MPYKDPDARRAYNKAYNATNREAISEYKRRYHQEHQEGRLEKAREYRRDHANKNTEYGRTYRLKNRDKVNQARRTKYQQSRIPRLLESIRRSAAKHGCAPCISSVQEIEAAYDGFCQNP